MILKGIVVGVKGMGRHHVECMKQLASYQCLGVCDRDPSVSAQASAELGVPDLGSYENGLAAGPDIAAISTPHSSHAALGLMALEAGVKGIFCEKPMTVHLGDARRLVAACREKGVALAVNHQRRMLPVFRKLKALLDNGAIGEVDHIRAFCAGDLLGDGTHLVNTLRFLVGEKPVEWVAGQVFGVPKPAESHGGEGFTKEGGYRFGHLVEEATTGIIQFEGGPRAEIATGGIFPEGRFYQDYEIFGSKGSIWRKSDVLKPNLLIKTDDRGYREVEVPEEPDQKLQPYAQFARMVLEGAPHPLSGDSALMDMEVITALYESARIREVVRWPVTQERFPLEILAGQA